MVFIGSLLFNVSCKKEETTTTTDRNLYEQAIESEGFTWYKNSDELLNRSAASGHSQAFLRTRFNRIAALNLDTTGKVKPQSVFADSSLIVKELWEDDATLALYAVLYKEANHAYADANGWVWAYLNTDGSAKISASNKGVDCNSCHSQTDNIDYTLMNTYFP
jgi:hypothetical protein